MLEVMGKKIFTILSSNLFLSKPVSKQELIVFYYHPLYLSILGAA